MTHQSGQLTMQAPSRRSLTASDRTLVALAHLVWSLVARLGLSPHTTFAAMYLTVAVILAVIAVVCALKRCSHLLLNSPILAPVGAPRPSSKDLVLRTFSSVNYAQKHAHEQLSTPHGAAPPHCAALRRATLRRTAPHTTPWCAAPRHAAPHRAAPRRAARIHNLWARAVHYALQQQLSRRDRQMLRMALGSECATTEAFLEARQRKWDEVSVHGPTVVVVCCVHGPHPLKAAA